MFSTWDEDKDEDPGMCGMGVSVSASKEKLMGNLVGTGC